MEILIAGGGYIGMYTARKLERLLRRGEATVTVVDPRGYMTYQPFLAEAAGGSVEPRHVIAPLPRVLRRTRVLTGKIVGIDHASRRAVFAPDRGPERVLRYDVLVLAAGSVSRVLPIEGLAEYGAGFKTVGEAVHLRNHVLGQLAVAASADDPAIRAAALTFVVVGGGFAGVEALAELQGLADEAVRFHPALKEAELRWVLVEATGRILPELDERLGQWTLRALRRRGVDVRLHTRLASAAHDTVLLDDGTEGVAQVYRIRLTGFGGWLAHRVYHLFWVPTLSHKARVLADWTLALFFRRETAQLTSLEHPADDFRDAVRAA